MTEEELDRKAETIVRKVQKAGTPQSSGDWLAVVTMLIKQSDDMLELLLRHARMLGVTWLARVLDGFLSEIAKGNTYRDAEGDLRLGSKPTSDGLQTLIT